MWYKYFKSDTRQLANYRKFWKAFLYSWGIYKTAVWGTTANTGIRKRSQKLISVQSFSHVWLFVSLWTAACQASLSFTIFQKLLKFTSIELVMPSNHPILCCPFSSCLRAFPASRSFPMCQFFASGGQSVGASASATVFQWLFRTDFLYDWLVWSPCSPMDSQESSPVPQFKSINSLVLSFLYGPTLISIHGYWKNHIFDPVVHLWVILIATEAKSER